MKEYKNLKIKDWAVEDRPREKLITQGARSLSDAELIAILIRSGNKNKTALELAKQILNSVNNQLNLLGKKRIEFYTSVKGMGEVKAINIIAALELGRRRKEADVFINKKITGSQDVAEIFSPLLSDIEHEEFWILLLDRSNRIIEKQMVSKGGISGTVIDIRLIMKSAIDKLASSLILCHNHPSGNLDVSEADKEITNKIQKAGNILDIPVLDHIIIGNNKYFSFADKNYL